MASKDEQADEDIRVLKKGTCPSLSGKSKLTYEVGCGASGELCLRIAKNSGTGFYSGAWVALERVHALLHKSTTRPITSYTLSPLFKGRSVNTAGFVLAVLKHEGLVQQDAEKPRTYEVLDGKAFMAEIQQLLGAAGTAGKASPKPPRKRPASVVTKQE